MRLRKCLNHLSFSVSLNYHVQTLWMFHYYVTHGEVKAMNLPCVMNSGKLREGLSRNLCLSSTSMDDCTESQEVEQCLFETPSCGEMYAQKGDEELFAKACVLMETFARLIAKMSTMKREDLNANYTAVKKTCVTEHCSKSVPWNGTRKFKLIINDKHFSGNKIS